MKKMHERVWEKVRYYARETWYFISSVFFLKNFAKMLAVIIGILLLLTWWMKCYTHHGESVQVQNYIGMNLREAVQKIKSRDFRYVLSDSIFLVDREPGEVIDQHPKPLSRVKENRTIYLTITKQTPDEVSLPDLVGNYDYNQYIKKLGLLGIRAKIKDRVFDNRLEENTILHFFYEGEKITEENLHEGVKVPMGSVLEFVITTRTGGMVEVPDLACLLYAEAKFIITNSKLSIGSIHEDDSVQDRDQSYIWKQEPPYNPGDQMRIGEQVTLYLTRERPIGCGQ